MCSIVLATYQQSADKGYNNAPDARLIAALEKLGIEAIELPWDDLDTDWDAFDAVLVRTTWDYHLRADTFRTWLNQLSDLMIPVFNPLDVLRWNMDKIYLRELRAAGVPIVPTVWGDKSTDLLAVMDKQGWPKVVIKPRFGASGDGLSIIYRDEVKSMTPSALDRTLIQPLLPEIHAGEYSFIFSQGRYLHTVHKRPAPDDIFVHEERGGVISSADPDPGLIAQAQAVIHAAASCTGHDLDDFVFSRVDGVLRDGQLLLMELELVEPELFFEHHPPAAERIAKNILKLLDQH